MLEHLIRKVYRNMHCVNQSRKQYRACITDTNVPVTMSVHLWPRRLTMNFLFPCFSRSRLSNWQLFSFNFIILYNHTILYLSYFSNFLSLSRFGPLYLRAPIRLHSLSVIMYFSKHYKGSSERLSRRTLILLDNLFPSLNRNRRLASRTATTLQGHIHFSVIASLCMWDGFLTKTGYSMFYGSISICLFMLHYFGSCGFITSVSKILERLFIVW